MMEEGWKHLYGVIGTTEDVTLDSQSQSGQIYPVTYKELSALVSDAPFVDHRGLAKDILLRHLLDHQRVIEGVMHSSSIIPFKFGSFAYTEKEVKQILTQGYSFFESLLPWVRERIEVELVAKWDREKVFKTLYEEESEIRSLQKMIEGKSGADTFLEKVKLGKVVQECLAKRKVLFKEKIIPQLKGCAESLCDHEVMDDLMILNTAFLLRKEMENEFDRTVQYLDQTFLGEVVFKLIGPLPLYSFKCVEIEWADANEIRNAFSILGLKEGTSLTDLKSAYHRKAQSIHPDKVGDLLNSPSEFEKVVKAYRLLSRCYPAHQSLPAEARILLMEVKTRGSND